MPTPKEKKLSYKDQRELVQLSALIETLETQQSDLEGQVSQLDIYRGDQSAAEKY